MGVPQTCSHALLLELMNRSAKGQLYKRNFVIFGVQTLCEEHDRSNEVQSAEQKQPLLNVPCFQVLASRISSERYFRGSCRRTHKEFWQGHLRKRRRCHVFPRQQTTLDRRDNTQELSWDDRKMSVRKRTSENFDNFSAFGQLPIQFSQQALMKHHSDGMM